MHLIVELLLEGPADGVMRLLFFFKDLFIFERDSACTQMGEGQREGDIESKAGSRLGAVNDNSPDTGLEPTNHEIMT